MRNKYMPFWRHWLEYSTRNESITVYFSQNTTVRQINQRFTTSNPMISDSVSTDDMKNIWVSGFPFWTIWGCIYFSIHVFLYHKHTSTITLAIFRKPDFVQVTELFSRLFNLPVLASLNNRLNNAHEAAIIRHSWRIRMVFACFHTVADDCVGELTTTFC